LVQDSEAVVNVFNHFMCFLVRYCFVHRKYERGIRNCALIFLRKSFSFK